MSYSLSACKNGCYPNTSILINKLDIREQEKLDKAEKMAVAVRTVELRQKKCDEPFTFDFYRAIHKALFGDIYTWAGEVRDVDISKKKTSFYRAEGLKALGEAKFNYLQKKNEFNGMPREEYIREIADFYHELNMLHPFREGNGRTERLFFSLLVERNGYSIDFANCDLNFLMTATVFAAQGVVNYLEDFFAAAIMM